MRWASVGWPEHVHTPLPLPGTLHVDVHIYCFMRCRYFVCFRRAAHPMPPARVELLRPELLHPDPLTRTRDDAAAASAPVNASEAAAESFSADAVRLSAWHDAQAAEAAGARPHAPSPPQPATRAEQSTAPTASTQSPRRVGFVCLRPSETCCDEFIYL